ncbi:MAG TPA: helix-hairpin-helix domain-containing protein [Candidatus Dormibacteraeota bacterium]
MRTDIRHLRVLAVVVVLGAALLLVGGVAAWRQLRTAPATSSAPVPLNAAIDPPAPPELLVFVSGAVVQPGLYRLSSAARIADAIAAAGGFTADADPGKLPNMAARVHDGKQVNVPFRRGASGSSGSTSIPLADRVDVNAAGVDELRAVPGMPLGVPEAIVDTRTNFGPFSTVSQLKADLGLDSVTFAAVRPFLRAGNSTR